MPYQGGTPRSGPMSRDLLDTPPPAPIDQAGAAAGLVGGQAAPPSGSVLSTMVGGMTSPAQAMAGLTAMAEDVDRRILALASTAPLLGPKLGQARQLLREAILEYLQTAVAGPQPAGPNFPGGGLGSV